MTSSTSTSMASFFNFFKPNNNDDSLNDNNINQHQQSTSTSRIPPSPYIAASPRWLTFISSPGYNYGAITRPRPRPRPSSSSTVTGTGATTGTGTGTGVQNTILTSSTPTSTKSASSSNFTPIVAFCFTLNYVVGTGFLTIPWAFVQSGILVSSLLLILASVLSDIAKDYLLEAMARAEFMLDSHLHWLSLPTNTNTNTNTRTSANATISTITTNTNGNSSTNDNKSTETSTNNLSSTLTTHFSMSNMYENWQKQKGIQNDNDDNDNDYDITNTTAKTTLQIHHGYNTSESLPLNYSVSNNERETLLANCSSTGTSSSSTAINGKQHLSSAMDDTLNTSTNTKLFRKLRQNQNNYDENIEHDSNDDNDDFDDKILSNSNQQQQQQHEYQSFSKLLSIPSSMTKNEQRHVQEQMKTPNRQRFVHNFHNYNNNKKKKQQQLQQQYLETNKNRLYIIQDRKFEMNALCRVYLGKRGLHVFTIFLSCYMCGTLCAYTNVFATALSRTYDLSNKVIYPLLYDIFDYQNNRNNNDDDTIVNSNYIFDLLRGVIGEVLDDNYILYVILFALIVVPMSCLELHEQITVQVSMTIGRFVMLFLMLTTSSYCASHSTITTTTSTDDADLLLLTSSSSSSTQSTNSDRSSNVHVTSILTTLPILVMANVFHHSIPGLSQPVQDKTKLGTIIFRSTIVCTTIMYTTIGVVLGTTFSTSTEQSANINWHNCYPHSTWSESTILIRIFKIICYYILLFPVLDVLSAFPLNAITLGNNMFGAIYGRNIHQVEGNWWLRTLFRLIASIPPLIIGMFVRELGIITDYTGMTGFVIAFTIPAMLYIKSTRMAQRKQFSTITYYTSYGSNLSIASFVSWFGISMVSIVFITLTFFRS